MAKIEYKGQLELFTGEGEVIACDVISKSSNDMQGWRRVIMADLLAAMDQIGNMKMKVLEYLINQMNSNNEINTTYRNIQTETGISLQTITETFKALRNSNLIKKHKSIYVLNCSIISAYGSQEKNKYLMLEYNFSEKSIVKTKSSTKELKEKERLIDTLNTLNTNLSDELNNLKEQLKELQNNKDINLFSNLNTYNIHKQYIDKEL